MENQDEIKEIVKYSDYNIQDILNMLDEEVKVTVVTNAHSNIQLSPLHTETDGLSFTSTIKK